ncbi:hypothetical protein AArcSl_0797 [Halalkaliarchaeum desulfuricum]|uniref:Small CPxCG-related zinc finger protein n=1 Tax=Halalkaliarchaeum desulfuricum TaxID=2055893 RepID=A0A343TH70_9EURY|nr:hypothetical protein [Halalkaliarchaeum desulfuricum]AUX08442.1 hypothetical protein AArcSl_0797 [Halalkaliarchaeum desulfuricum]
MGGLTSGDWFGRGEKTEVIFECRRCGRTLEEGVSECPECETESVVRYEIA